MIRNVQEVIDALKDKQITSNTVMRKEIINGTTFITFFFQDTHEVIDFHFDHILKPYEWKKLDETLWP